MILGGLLTSILADRLGVNYGNRTRIDWGKFACPLSISILGLHLGCAALLCRLNGNPVISSCAAALEHTYRMAGNSCELSLSAF
jgi:hypothetical protein